MERIYTKEAQNDHLLAPWCHLEPIAKGTEIAERASGEKLCAEKDSVIIFPNDAAPPGDEWFYIGVQEG
jgi:hypothetical protein